MKEDIFNEGDLIVVAGETIRKGAPNEQHYTLAKVIVAGKHDIFASTEENRPVTFRVSRARCALVSGLATSNEEVADARVGDLVMSITDRFGSLERKMGVVMEITNIPSKHPLVKILDADKEHVVAYDSIIILGEN